MLVYPAFMIFSIAAKIGFSHYYTIFINSCFQQNVNKPELKLIKTGQTFKNHSHFKCV